MASILYIAVYRDHPQENTILRHNLVKAMLASGGRFAHRCHDEHCVDFEPDTSRHCLCHQAAYLLLLYLYQ